MTVYIAFGTASVGKALFLALFERADRIDLVGHSRVAEEAIEQIRREQPALIIIEEVLRSGWGMDVVESITADNSARAVVMVSTLPPPRTPREYRSDNIDLWLQLPQDYERLQGALSRLTWKEPEVAIPLWREKLEKERSGQENPPDDSTRRE